MMHVFRIASHEYIHDLSGYGAKLNGGRWNREGVSVLYTGSSIALCAWEYWVHLPKKISLNQNAFAVATIQIPENSTLTITANHLPSDWETADEDLFSITDEWIEDNEYLVMQIPSAVISNECNYLINPLHSSFPDIRLESVIPFQFDQRAFGKVLLRKP